MPDEVDVPLEDVQDRIAEEHAHGRAHAAEEGGEERGGGWTRLVGVSTALLAVIAAIGALQSGLLVNEALLQKNEQIGRLTEASDQWNYYQAEGLKSLIYRTAAQPQPPGSPVAAADVAQAEHYAQKQADIQSDAQGLVRKADTADRAAERFLGRHHIFAFSVSLCQIAIALSAVAALTRRKRIWLFGVGAGAVGAALLLYGFLH